MSVWRALRAADRGNAGRDRTSPPASFVRSALSKGAVHGAAVSVAPETPVAPARPDECSGQTLASTPRPAAASDQELPHARARSLGHAGHSRSPGSDNGDW